jgi:hypothetical protein
MHEILRRLVGRDGHANAELEPLEGPEAVQIGRVVARVESALEAGIEEKTAHSSALVGVDGRPDLQHLPAETRHKAFLARSFGDLLEVGKGGILVVRLPVMERDRKALVLHGPVDAGPEGVDPLPPILRLRLELEAVRPDVADAVDADEPPGILARSAADARDERIPTGESFDLVPCLLRYTCVLRPRGDRSQGPVDVEHDRGAFRSFGESLDRRHHSYDTAVRLVLIGLVAGFFSALFGVGGGIIVVPLLILVARFPQRPAMATSLAAIGVIALVGSISYGLRGDVDLGYGALLGLPAAVGAIGGSAIQQRLPTRPLAMSFAALLAGIGVWLVIR